MKLKEIKLCIIFFFSSLVAEQTFSLKGKIIDSKTKEPLIGANVVVLGTAIGAASNMDGEFFISDISKDFVGIKVSYIGYVSKTFENLNVSSQEFMNIELVADVISVSGVEVQAERRSGSQAESIASKKEALEMQDNISADQISKSGDTHVADAVRRVTGVTIVNDKFLVVRGLGDRYSSAQLNSVGMPSPEADRRSVPLDLFSTALISGIDVAKSYRPDLPGAFGGGNVNIRTRLYPSRMIYKLKLGTGTSSNIMPGDNMYRNMQGSDDLLGFDIGESRDIPNHFNSELISYGSIPETFRTDLVEPIISNFTGDTIGWNSDPVREYLWFSQSYAKNNQLPNPFQNTIRSAGLPKNASLTYGTKYGSSNELEMGFLIDGSFSEKFKRNEERMDRYRAYNNPDDPGTIDEVYYDSISETWDTTLTYEKLLRPGFIGLDRDIYEYSTNMGMNLSAGLTFRENLRIGLRNVYTHTSKDNFTKASGMSGELTHDYKILYPGIDFSRELEGFTYSGEEWIDSDGDGFYDSNEEYIDSNGNGIWDPGDSLRVLDENGLLISQRYNEKAINLTTFSIENKFRYGQFKNEVDFKYTFGQSKMYEPFAAKSEWEYVRDILDPRIGDYTLYLRNGSHPGVSYNSDGKEDIGGFSYDHLLKSTYGDVKFGIKRDSKTRDFKRRYLYMDYSLFSLAINDSVTTSELDDYNGALGQDYWATTNPEDSTINEGLFFSEKTSGFDGYIATEDINALYIMFNRNFGNKLQVSLGARWEDYSMKMAPYHPVLGYKPFIMVSNGIWDENETLYDTNGNGVWDQGEEFVDTSTDTSEINFTNESKSFLPALTANYSLSDKAKVRTSFSKTVARAQFREYAPYVFQEFLGADETVGYPNLKNSTIQSSDIRYEYYPKGLELISVGFFQKHFKNPIEESLIAASGLSYTKSWQNGKYANIYGLEAEYRKGIDFVPAKYGFLFLNTNLSISKSEVVLPDSVYVYVVRTENTQEVAFPNNVDANDSGKRARPLQGQSNIVFNASLNFKGQGGYDINLAFNTYSKRLIRISNEVSGHFWERPFNSLNITANKKVGRLKFSMKVQNLLGEKVRIAHFFKDQYYNTQEYDPGRSFSVGVQYNN